MKNELNYGGKASRSPVLSPSGLETSDDDDDLDYLGDDADDVSSNPSEDDLAKDDLNWL